MTLKSRYCVRSRKWEKPCLFGLQSGHFQQREIVQAVQPQHFKILELATKLLGQKTCGYMNCCKLEESFPYRASGRSCCDAQIIHCLVVKEERSWSVPSGGKGDCELVVLNVCGHCLASPHFIVRYRIHGP